MRLDTRTQDRNMNGYSWRVRVSTATASSKTLNTTKYCSRRRNKVRAFTVQHLLVFEKEDLVSCVQLWHVEFIFGSFICLQISESFFSCVKSPKVDLFSTGKEIRHHCHLLINTPLLQFGFSKFYTITIFLYLCGGSTTLSGSMNYLYESLQHTDTSFLTTLSLEAERQTLHTEATPIHLQNKHI